MGKKLAIKGHETRSEEVIELLKMLGGSDTFGLSCEKTDRFYYVSDEFIHWDYDDPIVENKFEVFTLEEFFEKFPFKVGDFVRIPEYESEVRICKMKWTSFSDIDYLVYRNDDEEWYTAYELLEYNDNPTKTRDCKKCGLHFGSVKCFDKDCPHNTPKSYAVGLKDGKVIECGVNKETDMNKIKPLFKSGDVIKLKGCPDKNLFWIVVDVVEDGYIFNDGEKCSFDDQHHYEKSNREVINTQPDITAKVVNKNHKMGPKSKLPSKYYEETQSKREYDELRMPLDDDDKLATEVTIMDKKILPPDGYLVGKITQTDNGMLVEYVEKKSKYPTTYAECCEVLVGRKPNPYEISFDKMELCLVDLDNTQNIDFQNPYLSQLNSLFRLRMCRDAYWKIYGEETGLGKPWEPDWTDDYRSKYIITFVRNELNMDFSNVFNYILAFPTEELRNIFYENFKKEIEQCKELL